MRKNKQMRKIIFLNFDNMKNSSLFNLSHFFSCSFDSGFALDHLCFSIYIYILYIYIYIYINYPRFLVKVRLLWLYLVLENLKERGKEIERKKKRKETITTILR